MNTDEINKKVQGYSRSERIFRLIEITVKRARASPDELIEAALIQEIRESNGECDEVRRYRMQDDQRREHDQRHCQCPGQITIKFIKGIQECTQCNKPII